jgi:hypothetical protein
MNVRKMRVYNLSITTRLSYKMMTTKRLKRDREELPGADLGLGGVWGLERAVKSRMEGLSHVEALQAQVEELRMRCAGMLSRTEHTDVEFFFEGSRDVFRAHRGMLCAVSEGFRCMFRSGMAELQTGRVQVPPGVTVTSFKGFLEFVYLGKAGKKCYDADGRELWVLAEMYRMASLKKWLLQAAIHARTVCATYEFALVPEGIERSPMIKSCERYSSSSSSSYNFL